VPTETGHQAASSFFHCGRRLLIPPSSPMTAVPDTVVIAWKAMRRLLPPRSRRRLAAHRSWPISSKGWRRKPNRLKKGRNSDATCRKSRFRLQVGRRGARRALSDYNRRREHGIDAARQLALQLRALGSGLLTNSVLGPSPPPVRVKAQALLRDRCGGADTASTKPQAFVSLSHPALPSQPEF
jgi:hypothetical protein